MKITYIIAISLLALLLFGCNDMLRRMGDYVDKEKSEGYRYGRYDKDKIFYFGNESWGNTPKEITQADKKSFKVIGTYWAKDKYAVYRKNERFTNVDATSFTVEEPSANDEIGQEVLRDAKHVYYLNSDHTELQVTKSADPATFRDLGKHGLNHWAADKEHIFLNYKVFKADRVSFEILNDLFAKDKDYLFMNDYGISVREKINNSEIELLNPYHVRTKTRIYFFCGRPAVPVSFTIHENAKVETFNPNLNLIKVDEDIFVKGIQLKDNDMDVANFRYVGGRSYFSDGRRIYYCGSRNSDSIIPMSADAATFTTIGEFGKDSRYVYHRNNIIVDADPDTFQYDKENHRAYDRTNEYVYDARQDRYVERKKK